MSLKLKVKLGRVSGVVHTCEWCKYSTRSLNLFESHLNKCSPSASPVATTIKRPPQTRKKKKYWHKCDSCEFTANMIKEMTRHKAKYHGLKVIPCKECDYLARNRSKLNRHIGYRHSKNRSDKSSLLNITPSVSLNSSTMENNNFETSSLSINDSQFEFKLDKYYDEAFDSGSFDESIGKRDLMCRFCGCSLSSEEQFLNHLQNFHIPNDYIEHEIQTAPIAGKRKSSEISSYKCTNCCFCSEHKLVIVCHIIECHSSCLVSTHFNGMPTSFSQSFFSDEKLKKKDYEKIYGYSCSDCLYKTNFKRNLKLHRTHHGADAPFRCTMCNFAAFHEIAVSRHRNNYHVASIDKTRFNPTTADEDSSAIFEETIKEEPLSDCDSKTVCADLSSPEQSRFDDKNEQIWQCSFCPTRRYNDHKGLLKHMTLKHNECLRFPSWKCPLCTFTGRSKKNLKLHMIKRKHGTLINDESLQPTYDNVIFPPLATKFSDSSRNINATYSQNDGKPIFKCDHCPVSFGTYQAIAVHIAKAHKNEVVYKCADCSFTSNRKYLLRSHLLACSKICGKNHFETVDAPILSAESSGTAEIVNPVDPPNLRNLTKEGGEMVKYYGCSKCAYKTFRNFNLKKHIKLIHKGAKMIEILCQEEVHSNRDFGQKVATPPENYELEDIKKEESFDTCLDIEIKQEDVQDESIEPVVSTVDLDAEGLGLFDYEKTSHCLETLESEKHNIYYSDSKRMKCYKCLFCPKVTRGWNHYILHRKMHFNAMANSKHKCKHCSYSSSSIKFLKKHEMLHKVESEPVTMEQENCSPQEVKTTSTDATVKHKPQYTSVPPEYKVKSGYRCDACPFRAKDLKTFYVHKNLHVPRNAKYKCTKCTYEVDCISKLKVHSKVHTVDYLISNYKSVNKEPREMNKSILETKTEPQPICGLFSDVINANRNKQEEVDDCMETARNKHQIVTSKRLASFLINSSLDGKSEKQEVKSEPTEDDHETVQNHSEGFLVKRTTSMPSTMETLRSSNDLTMNGKVELWHCERCPFIGHNPESLHRHITLHMNKRMYECVYCNYSVPTFYYLLQHMKLHQAPNNNLIYAQSTSNLQFINSEDSTLDRHVNNYNLYENSRNFLSVPAKAFKCTYCPFSSRLRIFLVKHLKGHLNQQEHKCHFCTYSSNSRSEIRKHCQIHFNIPGSDMNAYPESDHVLHKDGKQITCQEFNIAFMEGIYTQFNLNDHQECIIQEITPSEETQNKCEFVESDSITPNEAKDVPMDAEDVGLRVSSNENSKDTEKDSLSGRDSLKVEDKEILPDSLENQEEENIKIMDKNDDSPPFKMDTSETEGAKKEDEEELYIEIDALEESENFDEGKNRQNSQPHETLLPLKDETTQNGEPEPPCICKYCGRVLKCKKSLSQHEAAHLASCLYLELTNADSPR